MPTVTGELTGWTLASSMRISFTWSYNNMNNYVAKEFKCYQRAQALEISLWNTLPTLKILNPFFNHIIG